uniref:Translation initiation factor eIF-2B delta subunit n=1 Tax=Arundo donax TaxID=35708 RepID=A0A0A9DM71_ARUDO
MEAGAPSFCISAKLCLFSPSSAADGARDHESSSPISDAASKRTDERTGAEVARTASAAAGDGEPGARWSAWRGGELARGEIRRRR